MKSPNSWSFLERGAYHETTLLAIGKWWGGYYILLTYLNIYIKYMNIMSMCPLDLA